MEESASISRYFVVFWTYPERAIWLVDEEKFAKFFSIGLKTERKLKVFKN